MSSFILYPRLIEGYLPIVALAIFMGLLPVYLMSIAKLYGIKSWLGLKLRVQSLYFWFLVVNVFLVTALSSSILSSIQAIIDDPSSALDLLGESIPASSTFFINYILLESLVGPAVELLQISRLVVQPLMIKLGIAKTPRSLAVLYLPPVYDYSLRYPMLGLVVLLGLIFSTIAPLVLIPIVLLFGVVHYITKVNFDGVYSKTQVDSGGLFYAKAVGHFWASIAFSQFVVL